jgi:hypothetical protein
MDVQMNLHSVCVLKRRPVPALPLQLTECTLYELFNITEYKSFHWQNSQQ